MVLTKLDSYDYILLPGVIRIVISGTNDPDLVDILSEITKSDGRVYVEGVHYMYLDNYRLLTYDGQSYMELDVTEVA